MTRVLLFTKAPVPGLTKTRLLLPPESAARLQAALIRDAFEKASALGLGPVSVTGILADTLGLIETLLPAGINLFAQGGGDLGERMFGAASRLFEVRPEPVLILGTDAPTLPIEEILAAAHALHTHEASIVDSDDGGYVLLGVRSPHDALFQDIRWSTATVYRETVRKALAASLSRHEGRPHYDVDTPEDRARVRGELRWEPGLAPRPAQALGGLR